MNNLVPASSSSGLLIFAALFHFLFITPFSEVSAQLSGSPQRLKLDAITKLEQVSTTDKKLQRTITKAIDKITRSLSDKGQPLFLDAFRIVPSKGEKVFEREREAVERLLKAIKRKNTSEDIKTVFQEVIDDLVEADRQIAALSIATAQQLVQIGEGSSKKLAKAQREFDRAGTNPRKAIKRYKKAWESSQEVVDDRELLITTFEDGPDPYSPSLTTNTLTATFRIREKGEHHKDDDRGKKNDRDDDDDDDGGKKNKRRGKDDDEKEHRQRSLEFVEIILDSSNATVPCCFGSSTVLNFDSGEEFVLYHISF